MREFNNETWDYGLAPGETFDPELDDDAPFDLTRPHVMTVLGPVEPDGLGFTLSFERVLAPPAGPNPDKIRSLNDLSTAVSALEGYGVTGGGTIVDLTPPAAGRRAGDLLWIAGMAPVNIVAATGPRDPAASAERNAAAMIEELTTGMDGTAARAGLIAIASDDRQVQAVAMAHLATGAPVALRGAGGVAALRMSRELIQAGVEPGAIMVAYAGSGEQDDLPLQLLDSDVYLAFRDWVDLEPALAEARFSEIAALARAGYRDRLLISGEEGRQSRGQTSGGGTGLTWAIDVAPLKLMDVGLSAPDVRALFFENPARVLTIRAVRAQERTRRHGADL